MRSAHVTAVVVVELAELREDVPVAELLDRISAIRDHGRPPHPLGPELHV